MKVLLVYWDTSRSERVSISKDKESLQSGIARMKEDQPDWWPERADEPFEVDVSNQGIIDLLEIEDVLFLEPDELDNHIKFPE